MDNTVKHPPCPCKPQCPHYGHCRDCIEAHRKYYTPPFCVRQMQKEMKEKHLHPINPHQKTTLTERIETFYREHPDEHLRSVAQALGITEWQLLDAMTGAIPVPTADYPAIYDRLAGLHAVLLHLDTGAVIFQLETALPPRTEMHEVHLLRKASDGMSMTALLFPQNLYAAFLVREQLYGKESLSLALVGEDERIALSFYLRRDAQGVMDTASKELFLDLWKHYAPTES